MRAVIVAVALAFVAVPPAAAAEQRACGPRGADTLAASDQARVYVDRDGTVAGCHRAGSRARRLGPRAEVSQVQVAGRFAAIVHTGGVDRLRLHDLRSGRLTKTVGAGGAARFTRIRLDRTGIAAYLLQSLTEQPPTVQVGTTEDPVEGYGPDIDPTVLGLAGPIVAYRRGDTYHLDAMWEAEAARRTLLRAAGVTFTVVRGRLRARRGRQPVDLGPATTPCISASGCSGIDALQVAGRFVAVRDAYYHAGESGGAIRVTDLRRGESRAPCRTTGFAGAVGGFVLTDGGSLACALRDGYWEDATFEIRSERAVIDQGQGIDVDSLARRDDRLVWVHDGVERSAPLPGR